MRCNKCKTENEKGAKFCSSCGASLEITEKAFTPNEHPKWGLYPISVAKLEVLNVGFPSIGTLIGYFILCALASFIILIGLTSCVPYVWLNNDLIFLCCCIIVFSPFLLCLFMIIYEYVKRKIQKEEFLANVDYVGKSISHYVVIAKTGKLGLFDSQKNKIVLCPKYDNFYKESELIVVENNGKFGCLNPQLDTMIIPTKFDDKPGITSPGVIEVHTSNQTFYFDKFGKQLS